MCAGIFINYKSIQIYMFVENNINKIPPFHPKKQALLKSLYNYVKTN